MVEINRIIKRKNKKKQNEEERIERNRSNITSSSVTHIIAPEYNLPSWFKHYAVKFRIFNFTFSIVVANTTCIPADRWLPCTFLPTHQVTGTNRPGCGFVFITQAYICMKIHKVNDEFYSTQLYTVVYCVVYIINLCLLFALIFRRLSLVVLLGFKWSRQQAYVLRQFLESSVCNHNVANNTVFKKVKRIILPKAVHCSQHITQYITR